MHGDLYVLCKAGCLPLPLEGLVPPAVGVGKGVVGKELEAPVD